MKTPAHALGTALGSQRPPAAQGCRRRRFPAACALPGTAAGAGEPKAHRGKDALCVESRGPAAGRASSLAGSRQPVTINPAWCRGGDASTRPRVHASNGCRWTKTRRWRPPGPRCRGWMRRRFAGQPRASRGPSWSLSRALTLLAHDRFATRARQTCGPASVMSASTGNCLIGTPFSAPAPKPRWCWTRSLASPPARSRVSRGCWRGRNGQPRLLVDKSGR